MRDFFRAHRLVLAPMAGVSDRVFRRLCREQGADLAFTEMVSAKGLSSANGKTRGLLDLAEGEDRVAVQIFGHEPQVMAAEAAWIEQRMGPSLACLDINMGCPARKIVSKGDGCALMQNPGLAFSVIEAVVGAVSVPVTVKFRRGYRLGEETAVAFAAGAQAAGAAALTVHGRFAQQLYRGEADWGVVARVRQAVSIPVIGNGDVRCGTDAAGLIRRTGCDAVMIARGAQGNPWVFAEARAALAGACAPAPPSVSERLSLARRHAALLGEEGGNAMVRMRRHAMWYLTGLPHAGAARRAANAADTADDFIRIFDLIEEAIRKEHHEP